MKKISHFRFEYILMAPTSAAVPIYEEPVTFLNQFHPYEIKCRKVDGSLNFSSIFYKASIILFNFY